MLYVYGVLQHYPCYTEKASNKHALDQKVQKCLNNCSFNNDLNKCTLNEDNDV